MFKLLIFTLFANIITINIVKSDEICYNELGCFSNLYPFGSTLKRPLIPLPESPEKINVKFRLYNRKLKLDYEYLNYSFVGNNFDPNISTKIIIHGYMQNALRKWIIDMKNEFLKTENVNVITTDWHSGSFTNYPQSVSNCLVVAAEIARLIKNLEIKKNAQVEKFHLIGHSLGAHIAGYVGTRIAALGRITGLDPAGPYFENTDPIVRLDPSDALFVDVLHTETSSQLELGFGIIQESGHVDFYINGGTHQPDCPSPGSKFFSTFYNYAIKDYERMTHLVSCSHRAAIFYFIDSIRNNSCKFTSFPCSSKQDFDSGKCLKCNSTKGCNRMGYWASADKELGPLYLNTQSPLEKSYCKQNYLVTLYSDYNRNSTQLSKTLGNFTVYFESLYENSSIEIFDNMETVFKPGSNETRLISLNEPLLYEIENVYISFKKISNFFSYWLYDDEWSFKLVEVFSGDTQVMSKFCPNQTIISNQTVKFSKC